MLKAEDEGAADAGSGVGLGETPFAWTRTRRKVTSLDELLNILGLSEEGALLGEGGGGRAEGVNLTKAMQVRKRIEQVEQMKR
jgi:hypothetical protein